MTILNVLKSLSSDELAVLWNTYCTETHCFNDGNVNLLALAGLISRCEDGVFEPETALQYDYLINKPEKQVEEEFLEPWELDEFEWEGDEEM